MSILCQLFVLTVITMKITVKNSAQGYLSKPNLVSFVPAQDFVRNSFLCAVDPPSAVLLIADLLVGVPVDIPEDVVCGLGCTGYSGCTSFNYKQQQNGPSLCELYTYVPRNCSTVTNSATCKHYETSSSSFSCLAEEPRTTATAAASIATTAELNTTSLKTASYVATSSEMLTTTQATSSTPIQTTISPSRPTSLNSLSTGTRESPVAAAAAAKTSTIIRTLSLQTTPFTTAEDEQTTSETTTTTTVQSSTTTSFETTTGATQCRGTFSPSLYNSINGTLQIQSMALFNDQLFVVRNLVTPTDQIEVYNSSSLDLLRNITLPGATDLLTGLAVDPSSNSLYVTETSSKKLYNLNLTTLTATNWSTSNFCFALSVNSAHNVLVGIGGGKIEEYTPNGTFVRQITVTPTTITAVWQAVELSNGTLVASRGGSMSHDVCLIFNSSVTIRCYGSTTPGSGPGKLNTPRGLAVDKDDYILLAEWGNNRIVAFDPTLSVVRSVLLPLNSTNQLNRPRALVLDESRDRLYVGEGGGLNRILIFNNFSCISDMF